MSWPDQESFSEPWMVAWLEAAASSLSVVEACRRAGVGLAHYLLARRCDTAFDQAALVFDQIVDLMIRESVRQAALDGDSQAARLYFTRVQLPSFLPPFATWHHKPEVPDPRRTPLPPHVAEAMLSAYSRAMREPPPPPEPKPSPRPWSRPES